MLAGAPLGDVMLPIETGQAEFVVEFFSPQDVVVVSLATKHATAISITLFDAELEEMSSDTVGDIILLS